MTWPDKGPLQKWRSAGPKYQLYMISNSDLGEDQAPSRPAALVLTAHAISRSGNDAASQVS